MIEEWRLFVVQGFGFIVEGIHEEASHEMNATAIVESTMYLTIKTTSNENVRARARQ